jgi:hypothetical protein
MEAVVSSESSEYTRRRIPEDYLQFCCVAGCMSFLPPKNSLFGSGQAGIVQVPGRYTVNRSHVRGGEGGVISDFLPTVDRNEIFINSDRLLHVVTGVACPARISL